MLGHEMQHNSSSMFNSQQPQKWEDLSVLNYSMRIHPSSSEFNQPLDNSSLLNNLKDFANQGQMNGMIGNDRPQDWDPRSMLNDLSFLKQKINQLQELIHTISGQKGHFPGSQDELFTQQQQLITADLTSIIVQLISTAGSLLPSAKASFPLATNGGKVDQTVGDVRYFEKASCETEMNCKNLEEEHESKEEDDGKEEHLPPGSYEILQLEKEEILAPHTHFCTICGKGFKRDANLRMHMRGHGDEYKTAAALAKPNKDSSSEQVLLKRYSCPSIGCKRNKVHKKFQPLKTILCVKNHYKRTHCDKRYICSRCHTKKFSVMADLKTHEKHCGRDKWLCSCGTTFSRKDKLFGHIALFQGHTPAIPFEDNKPSVEPLNVAEKREVIDEGANVDISHFGFDSGNGIDEDAYFSPLNYDCSFGELQEFLQGNFDDLPNSYSFFMNGEKSGMQSGTDNME